MEALLQALHNALGQEAAEGLINHSGMRRFLNYCRRQLPEAWAWQPLGECIAAELLHPQQPPTIAKRETIARLQRASQALHEAARALEALQAAGFDAAQQVAALQEQAMKAAKIAKITEAMAPNGSRHHQGDAAQHSMALRLSSAVECFLGRPAHGHAAALAGLIEAITGRPCNPIYVRRWLKDTP